MATKVEHGPRPKFRGLKMQRGRFYVRLVGRYTHTPGLGAGGVTDHAFSSDQARKRRVELLILRSIFVSWFMGEWRRNGGTWTDGIRAFTGYPFDRMRRSPVPRRSFWRWLWS